MNNERPFENIDPVPNIKVGYFEKEEYLKIIDRQEKQIQSLAWKILALQSSIEILEKWKRPQGKWRETGYETGALGITYRQTQCSNCGLEHALPMWWNFCPNCGAKMEKSLNE